MSRAFPPPSLVAALGLACGAAVAHGQAEFQPPLDLEVGDMLLEPGQVRLGEPSQAHAEPRVGAPEPALVAVDVRPWPSGRLPVEFDRRIGVRQRIQFVLACARWTEAAGVRCSPRGGEAGYLKVESAEGCSSSVGYRGGREHPIRLGRNCWRKSTLLHELGHAFGLMHEHQRPDRDAYIEVLWDHISDHRRWEYELIKGYDLDTPYDFDSIMHYPASFGPTKDQETFVGRPGYEGRAAAAGQGDSPSELDAEGLRRLYADSLLGRWP